MRRLAVVRTHDVQDSPASIQQDRSCAVLDSVSTAVHDVCSCDPVDRVTGNVLHNHGSSSSDSTQSFFFDVARLIRHSNDYVQHRY